MKNIDVINLDIDYQVKKDELIKEQIFLNTYTDNNIRKQMEKRIYSDEQKRQ